MSFSTCQVIMEIADVWFSPTETTKTEQLTKHALNCPHFLLTCLRHSWEEPGSLFLCPAYQVFLHIYETTPEPSLLQAEESQLSQPLLIWEMLHSPQHHCWPVLELLHKSVSHSYWGAWNWTQHSKWASPVLTSPLACWQSYVVCSPDHGWLP